MATTCNSSPVLLGLCDSVCPDKQLSPYENKIGGHPDFYPDCVLTSPPSCRVCGADQVLLVQVYCPLEGSVYHRLLHVFCCSESQCWSDSQSWCVLRSQLRDESCDCHAEGSSEGIRKTVQQRSSAGDWCKGADNWGSDSEEDSSADICKGKASNDSAPPVEAMATLSIASVKSKTVKEHPAAAACCGYEVYFPPCYISVIEEPKEHTYTETEVESLLQKCPEVLSDESATKSQLASGKSDADRRGSERYEKAMPSHGDRTFAKFQKQLEKCPQQILRYQINGHPLLVTDKDTLQPPETMKCRHCQSNCVFELQLMPALVYLLQTAITDHHKSSTTERKGKSSIDGCLRKAVEFGTVLVYSCARSCWEEEEEGEGEEEDGRNGREGFRQEWVTVQTDSQTALCDKFLKS